jgi:hypothetical protein
MPNWTSEIEARLASLRLAAGREAEIVEELSLALSVVGPAFRAARIDPARALRSD